MGKFRHIHQDGNQVLTYSTKGTYVVYLDNVSGKFDFELEVPDITLMIYGAFKGKMSESCQLRTTQHHKSPGSTSNLLIKGVFEDESRFEYHGLIRIEKDCNGSHAYQKNQNLVLSDRVFVKSEPDLEILSNDVFCTHGSSTGGPNKEQLYFMQSRGLDEKDAISLLKDGFLDEVYSHLNIPPFGRGDPAQHTVVSERGGRGSVRNNPFTPPRRGASPRKQITS